jgi:hypothetical protein
LSKYDEKTIPKDLDSDYSLPGRFEESNSVYFDAKSEKVEPKNRGILILAIGFLIFSSAFFSYYFINQNEIDSRIIENNLILNPEKKLVNQYGVGKYGSEHAHAAIVIFVNGELVNFGLAQFQLLSNYIHFENHNSYQIHKHASGVPLEMLFASLGMKITQDCMLLNYSESDEIKNAKFCSEQGKSLTFYVNGEQFHSNLHQYVFEHNDRILISFGENDSVSEQLAYLESLRILDIPKKAPQYSGDGITI